MASQLLTVDVAPQQCRDGVISQVFADQAEFHNDDTSLPLIGIILALLRQSDLSWVCWTLRAAGEG